VIKEERANPSDLILAEAQKGYDLLVLTATERRAGGAGSMFERYVDDVIQESPCSLLVVSLPTDDDRERRVDHLPGSHILVPISGGDSDRHAAEVAFAVAAGHDTTVDIVHVVSGPQHTSRLGGDDAIMHAVGIGEDVVNKMAELGRSMGATVETDVLVADHPENAIVERAGRRADLVVLASTRRPVTQRAFFGHRIDYVVCNATCPVIVVSAR
jgi:nucleotide-binding universal stress UspA family protein